MEERLDKLLVQRNLVNSRVEADKLIKETGVNVNGKLITKTGKRFLVDCDIQLLTEELPWISTNAIVLLAAIEKWQLEIEGKVILEIGAGIGGFTEVLLKNGASKVFTVDSKPSLLHETLIENDKVCNLDKTHVRELTSNLIDEPVDGCIIDVSSISLEKIIPFAQPFVKQGGFVILIVKPQFELDKEFVGKGGIVKDTKLYPQVIKDVKNYGQLNTLRCLGHLDAPILSEDGNREFIMYLTKEG
ncbi:MAG: TlyA family RNA methyltransferase [Crocinitomicaceae bacterium]|nr:TlyA family RNA methyltransferase [Crocinitomicaceae bacterium]